MGGLASPLLPPSRSKTLGTDTPAIVRRREWSRRRLPGAL